MSTLSVHVFFIFFADVWYHDSLGITYQVIFQYFYPLNIWKKNANLVVVPNLASDNKNMHLRCVGVIQFIFHAL